MAKKWISIKQINIKQHQEGLVKRALSEDILYSSLIYCHVSAMPLIQPTGFRRISQLPYRIGLRES